MLQGVVRRRPVDASSRRNILSFVTSYGLELTLILAAVFSTPYIDLEISFIGFKQQSSFAAKKGANRTSKRISTYIPNLLATRLSGISGSPNCTSKRVQNSLSRHQRESALNTRNCSEGTEEVCVPANISIAESKFALSSETILHRLNNLTDAVLEAITCPVCYQTVSPPITQCRKGHLLCETCRESMISASNLAEKRKCPTCRIPMLGPLPRCLALERIASQLTINCRHPSCPETLNYLKLRAHEDVCHYAQIRCPYDPSCHWCGYYCRNQRSSSY